MSETAQESTWMIVELMGHVRMAGRVTEEEKFGGNLGRIEIPVPPYPDGSERWVTQWFGAASVYRITVCDEETARRTAALGVPAPVHAWELPKQLPSRRADPPDDDPEADSHDDSNDDGETPPLPF